MIVFQAQKKKKKNYFTIKEPKNCVIGEAKNYFFFNYSKLV